MRKQHRLRQHATVKTSTEMPSRLGSLETSPVRVANPSPVPPVNRTPSSAETWASVPLKRPSGISSSRPVKSQLSVLRRTPRLIVQRVLPTSSLPTRLMLPRPLRPLSDKRLREELSDWTFLSPSLELPVVAVEVASAVVVVVAAVVVSVVAVVEIAVASVEVIEAVEASVEAADVVLPPMPTRLQTRVVS